MMRVESMTAIRRSGWWFGGLLTVVLGTAVPTIGASRAELTWLPRGGVRLSPQTTTQTFRLPRDYAGVIREPVVLLAAYVPDPHVTPVPTQPTTSGPVEGQARLKMKIGENELPEWIVGKTGSAYVINVATIEKNPKYAEELLEIHFDAVMYPGEVYLYCVGSPDPLVVSDSLDGPLSLFAEKADDKDAKTYFEGLIAQFAGKREDARKKFSETANSSNERIGMFARRGLRLLKTIERVDRNKEGFASRYRWGLFLQQCGFFQAALEDFKACVEKDRLSGSSAYRLGEVMDSAGGNLADVVEYCDRAGLATEVRDPTTWNVLVTFLRKRTVQVERDGKLVTEELKISDADVQRLKDQWIAVEKLVYGASRGTLRLNTSFYSIPDEKNRKFVKYDGWLTGPAEGIVEQRGWFDAVISIRPHVAGERDETGGGDVGPKGAALSDIGMDADWQRLFRHFYHQLDWTLIVGECGPGAPMTDESVGCGVAPIPTAGFGLRAAMRYYMTPAMFRHAKVVPTVHPPASFRRKPLTTTQAVEDEPEAPKTYLRYWRVFGPVKIGEAFPASGEPASHVLDSVATSQSDANRVIDSTTDFIDLRKELGADGWSVARAVCWVWSPELQHVQMWIGQNDRAAVWVNGRCVHHGRYASICNYADSNQVDQVASFATLDAGWNRIEVAIEGWPAPKNKGWGFSIRLATFDGGPVTGLRYSVIEPTAGLAATYVAPETGYYYSWGRVESAFHELLPQLSDADLEKLTALRGIRVRGKVEGAKGMVALEVPGRKESAEYRLVPAKWDVSKDRDVRLNNLLDWAREDTLAIRYQRDGHPHDLLIMKPEAGEAYLTLLKEPAEEAKAIFGQLAPANRVVGYLPVPAEGGSSRSMIVADVLISPEGQAWPVDEEDLMEPEQK